MALLTLEEASERLRRTPRTIRRWIAQGLLSEHHPNVGYTSKFLVDEEEVEQLVRDLEEERQRSTQVTLKQKETILAVAQSLKQVPGPAASEDITKRLEQVEHWLSDLQRWYGELEQRLEALEQGVSSRAGRDGEASPRPLQKQPEPTKKGRPVGSVTQAETPKELPSGSIILKDFAEKCAVRPMTFRDHIKIGRYGEKVAAEKIFKRETAKGPEYEYWLTPEQQLAALDFWKRHHVPFTLPHDQDQEEQPE